MIHKGKYVRIYKGKEAIKNLIEEFSAMQKTGDIVYSFGYEDKFDQALGKGWWKTLRKMKTAHTRFQGVYSWHKKARKPSSTRAKTRYLKTGKGETEIAIYKDTVRIFALTRKNPYAVLIRDPVIAKGFMNYWKFLWQQGKEARK